MKKTVLIAFGPTLLLGVACLWGDEPPRVNGQMLTNSKMELRPGNDQQPLPPWGGDQPIALLSSNLPSSAARRKVERLIYPSTARQLDQGPRHGRTGSLISVATVVSGT